MSAGKWHSRYRKDRDINPAFGDFDLGDIADRAVQEALRRLQWELSKLHKGCHIIQYGLRAECWGPEIAKPVFGPKQAEAGQFIPVYTRAFPNSPTITVWLPDARDSKGETVEVKDVDGAAATRNITIKTLGTDQPGGTFAAQKIDGATSLTISSNYGSAQLRSDGVNWYLLSGAGTVSLPEDLQNIVNAWGVDVAGNLTGVGTMASGAHTMTQATDETEGEVNSYAVGTDTLREGTTVYYDAAVGSVTLATITPIADGTYKIQVFWVIEVTTAAGDGNPALGDQRQVETVSNFKIAGGTVTQLGTMTTLYDKATVGSTISAAVLAVSVPMAATTITLTAAAADTEVSRVTACVKITRLST